MKSELVRATNHLNIGKGRCNGWIEQPEEIKSGIYCWTNNVNGKKYIGKSIDLRERRRAFLRFGEPYAGAYINKAREKYNNADYWHYSMIVYCSPNQLNEVEKNEIKQNRAFCKHTGYNLTLGGDGGLGTKSAQRKAVKQYSIEGVFIREWDCITEAANFYGSDSRTTITSCCKGETLTSYGFQWRYADDETPVKPLEQYRKYKVKIRQYTMSGEFIQEFNSAMDAARSIGKKDNSDIIGCCKGKQRFAQGFQWRYADDDTPVIRIKKRLDPVNKRGIKQYNIKGELIREFESLTAVNEEYGFRIADVCSCCKHKRKSAFGFQWRYSNDETPISAIKLKRQKMKINQYNLDGTFLRDWNTVSEIEKELGFDGHNIRACCRGVIKTSSGFIWRYKE